MKNFVIARLAAVVAGALLVFGCSTIVEGTSQVIVVSTEPAAASCDLSRQGVAFARIDPTPGKFTVKKTKDDIVIVCTKPGYLDTTYVDRSGVAAATFGNAIVGGLVGWGVDSATGADNKYETAVYIKMVQAAAPER